MVEHLHSIFSGGEYWLPSFLADESGSVVDVGAGIGETTLLLRAAFPRAVIYAAEPNPRSYEYLLRNIKGVAGIRPHPVALADYEGEADLYEGAVNCLTDSLLRTVENSPRVRRVAVVKAAEFFREVVPDPVTLIKVDVEGLEWRILQDLYRGGRLGGIKAVALETHQDSTRRDVDDLLHEDFVLAGGRVLMPHRYVFTYVRKAIIARTNYDRFRVGSS